VFDLRDVIAGVQDSKDIGFDLRVIWQNTDCGKSFCLYNIINMNVGGIVIIENIQF
jgi:hypothetical protein